MINTINIKQQQLHNGFFKIGTGEENILIMGSCRVCPYINYLNTWNIENNNRFTIYSLDPFNFNWNEKDERVDYTEALKKCESDERISTMFKSIDFFVYEFYKNAKMFNCDKNAIDGIYSYGLNPKINVCVPSWNDVFVLFTDIVSFDANIRKKAIQDYNVIGKLSEETQHEIFQISQNNLHKFYEICLKSDFPEMKEFFQCNMKEKRMFWTYNHVSKEFTYFIFVRLMKKFLGIDLSEQFIRQIYQMPDMFANNYTYLTQFDLKWYGFNWGEEVRPLRDRL